MPEEAALALAHQRFLSPATPVEQIQLGTGTNG